MTGPDEEPESELECYGRTNAAKGIHENLENLKRTGLRPCVRD